MKVVIADERSTAIAKVEKETLKDRLRGVSHTGTHLKERYLLNDINNILHGIKNNES